MHIDSKCHGVRISGTAEVKPLDVVTRHCTDCETFSGAPSRVSVAVPLTTQQLTPQAEAAGVLPIRSDMGHGRP